MVVGLTGGIASGKTTVARMLAALGATVVDADRIGRAVVEDRPEVLQQLVAAFGQSVLTPAGALDRRKLGRIAFSSPGEQDKLNAIVHPHLLEELRAEVERAASQRPRRPVVIDAALLLEWILGPASAGLLPRVDAIVVVLAGEATQMARLTAKGVTPDEARQRIRAQLPADQRAAHADYLLRNEGSLKELEQHVSALWWQIHRASSDRGSA